jgi:hypothetical protein
MATDMPPHEQSSHWRRRWSIVAGVLLLIVGLFIADAYWRAARRQWLMSEVHAGQGTAVGNKPLWERLKAWYQTGEFPERPTMVLLLGDKFNDAWIRKHDYLRGLQIAILESQHISGNDLAELIDSHPLELLDAKLCQLSDDAVAAIGRKTKLKTLSLFRTNLSDDDLAQLPLEQLELLHVMETDVTAEGFTALARCRCLDSVGMDADQLTHETAQLLASLQTVKRVYLHGANITDVHLQHLQQVSTLEHAHLPQTQTTAAGRAAFAAALPECEVETP